VKDLEEDAALAVFDQLWEQFLGSEGARKTSGVGCFKHTGDGTSAGSYGGW